MNKEQSLEQFLHLDRIDIGRLTIENPKIEKELPFDAERDIGPEIIQRIKRDLRHTREGRRWDSFVAIAKCLKLLFPQRQADLGLDEQAYQGVRGRLEQYIRDKHWGNFLTYAVDAKLLFPHHQNELGLTEVFWKEMQKTMEGRRERKEWGGLVFYAKYCKILFPQHQAEIELDDEAWLDTYKDVEDYRAKGHWNSFCEYAVRLKLSFPQRQAELKLDDVDWQGMNKELARQLHECIVNGEEAYPFFAHALNMQILSAEEAYINEKGEIVINMRKSKVDLRQEKTPMPKVRNF